MDIAPILDCALMRWSPAIGDRSLVAWITVAAYALAAVLAFRAARRAEGAALAERLFWSLAAAYLAALAVNKQLDLQTLMTVTGRCAARMQGWYDSRRTVQVEAILALVGASLSAGLVALWLLRRTLRRTGIALLGLVWITGFVLVRAVGFHHADRLLGLQVTGLRLNWLFELGGIAVFILGAARAGAARPRREAGTRPAGRVERR